MFCSAKKGRERKKEEERELISLARDAHELSRTKKKKNEKRKIILVKKTLSFSISSSGLVGPPPQSPVLRRLARREALGALGQVRLVEGDAERFGAHRVGLFRRGG